MVVFMSSQVHSLLPRTSTEFEKDLEKIGLLAGDLGDLNLSIINDPYKCPESMLSWLAYTRHVDSYDDRWPIDKKRSVIAGTPEVHLIKGTIKSVRDAIRFAGYGEITIKTRGFKWFYNGARRYNGTTKYGESSNLKWAQYAITLQFQTSTRQSQIIKALINATAPARCELVQINYERSISYNGNYQYDGQYSYGVD